MLDFKIKSRLLDFLMIIVKNDCNHGDSNHNGICNWGHGYDS